MIDDICNLEWGSLTQEDLINVAWAYYYFSTQFRESLEIARSLYPDDDRLLQLDHGERDTDNLSPWPGVAAVGERMNHDEFMRRTLELTAIPEQPTASSRCPSDRLTSPELERLIAKAGHWLSPVTKTVDWKKYFELF